MRVIGTAGHVDHGKSTLIAALTGTHPDRLKEEQEREMTIELGFGWLTLPDGQEVGIVDVPGHRDFIANMLAGVGGIDAALLIVAADEGVMPQTREHLAILDLLHIPKALVVITKVDMADDPAWLDLIEKDIRATLQPTALKDAPFVRVSARTGQGMDALKHALVTLLHDTPDRMDLGRPRLPVDRVFTMPGFGTVVTGTLSDGVLRVGDDVEILPTGLSGRIRGLQTHKKKEEAAVPGSRTAVNISGVRVEDLARGQVVAAPGRYAPTRRIDARLRLLGDISAPLKHASEIKFFIGASESIGTIRLLEDDTLAPGAEGWVQIELREPVVAARGDRFILRRPSPSETLGGGSVADAAPKERHKRRDPQVWQALAALAQGSPADVLLQASFALGAESIKAVMAKSGLQPDTAQAALQELVSAGTLIWLEAPGDSASDALIINTTHWQALHEQITRTLGDYHAKQPLRLGMPREELKSKLGLKPRLFNAALAACAAQALIKEDGARVSLAGFQVQLTPAQDKTVKTLLAKFAAAPYATPSVKEAQAEAGDALYTMLVESGTLYPVSADVVFRRSDYDAMLAQVRAHAQQHGRISVAEARDLFNTSRKYVLGLLEHLDTLGITARDGDYRVLRK